MVEEIGWPLEVYRELEPLCEKGRVMLVQNSEDGQLYVKKRVQSYAPELYRQLMEEHVENTPVIYGIFEDPDTRPEAPGAVPLVIIEEYVPGQTLAEYLREWGTVSEDGCFRIGSQLCEILMELHSRKPAIIHRDIKPSNVIVQPDGVLKLLDFSAAKNTSNGERRDTVLIGTAGFAAPEQYGFSVSTPQTDLYAMGVLLNTLRTGSLPWEKRAGGRLKYVIGRCLKIDPKDRFADARELRAALKRAQREQVSWLLPGFRTLRWYRMIPALAWYLYIYYFALTEQVSTEEGVLHVIASRILYAAVLLFPTLFYGDYLHIQRFFPFMRSRHRLLRILGLAIAPLLTLFLSVVVYLFVSAFVYATGRAIIGY